MDWILRLKPYLRPVVRALGLRAAAGRAYRLLLRGLYGRSALVTATANGRRWRLDRGVAEWAAVYEPDTVRWLHAVLAPGAAFLDVGANVGLFALEAAALVGPAGKVLAVEPAPGNLAVLRAHVEENALAGRVEVVAAACAATDGGTIDLLVVGDDPNALGSGHTLRGASERGEGGVRIAVPLTTIDAVRRRAGVRLAAVKIDVEGAEVEAVRGAVETLAGDRPAVWLAFHPGSFDDPAAATADLRGLFDRCGYDTPAPEAGGAYTLREYDLRPRPTPP